MLEPSEACSGQTVLIDTDGSAAFLGEHGHKQVSRIHGCLGEFLGTLSVACGVSDALVVVTDLTPLLRGDKASAMATVRLVVEAVLRGSAQVVFRVSSLRDRELVNKYLC
jgi:hypothetical protein